MMPPSLESLQTLHTENPPQDSNPWSDSAPTPPLVMQPLHPPSPGALEDLASGETKSDDDRASELDSHVHADTLDTFDPLAHHEEQSARDAWANAEGHPPPTPPKQDLPPPPRESTASTSTFPSFSSFARSFALPSLPNMNMSLVAGTRARPQSLDTATLMPTPVHSTLFASQQQDTETSNRGSPKIDPAALPPHAVLNALRREDPSRERTGAKDKDPPFDFQKFLDQMKSKSAEPVARYLRSCVLPLLFFDPDHIVLCHRFLSNFARRTFTVTDQVKLINDFLNVGSPF
jgi:hypothetical protein